MYKILVEITLGKLELRRQLKKKKKIQRPDSFFKNIILNILEQITLIR